MATSDGQKCKLAELVWGLFYDSFYQESAADAMVNRWQRLDEVVKILVAVTATGSAVSGWALWQNPQFKSIWALIAGCGAVLAIIHTELGVSGRIREWVHMKRYFLDLRCDLERFDARMKLDEVFAVEEYHEEVMRCCDRLKEGIALVRNDILFTSRLGKKTREGLDERLVKEPRPIAKPVPAESHRGESAALEPDGPGEPGSHPEP